MDGGPVMLIASLRGRLFVGLTVFVVGTALVAGYLAFRWAFDEAIELQDAILLQVGSLAANNRLQGRLPSEGNIDGEAQLLIQDLHPRSGTGSSGSSHPDLPDNLSDGLQTIPWNGGQWRVLVRTRSDGSRVAVGQPTANRDEVAQDSALRTIVPLGVLIPCLMVVIAIVVNRSLRPLSNLAKRLDAKRSDHLERLPVEGIPTEIVPFVASINRLLERIGVMFDKERRFVADAAHELRTPVTALVVQADNLDRAVLSEDGLDRLQSLKTGIRRIAHLLEQLLAQAKYDSDAATDPPSCELDRIVKGVVADLLPMARDKLIDLGFTRLEDASVLAEPVALGVLARNLIDNAIRHTSVGGRVDVSLFVDDERVTFQVDDTGAGIPDAEIDQIFEPFFRGSGDHGEGTGLGLSIARSIVERCGGTIGLANKRPPEENGLRVKVHLPAGDAQAHGR